MKETKVLVVFTGGTIGSVPKDGFLSPGGEEPRRLLTEQFAKEKQAFYEEKFQTRISFETVCPYEILSENLNGKHLEALWRAVKQGTAEHYDGIVITTGTDSLAYSSAAMGYLFADTDIPIVMVSANYPLTDERSNGFDNFEGAMILILEREHKGVFCSYKNGDGHYIHYATRLLAQANYSDQVLSVKDGFYAKLEQGVCRLNRKPAGESNVNFFGAGNQDAVGSFSLRCENMTKASVCFLRPYPGMRFFVPDSCDAVLLDTYHSGTLPVKESGFEEFMKNARKRRLPVWIAGVPGGVTYETVASYQKEGAFVLPTASPVAMYVKLWLLLANGLDAETYMPMPMGYDILT